MRNYSSQFKPATQAEPIHGRTDMAKNSAGGYVFKATELDILNRFVFLGTENGTYYAGETELTVANAKKIIKFIKADSAQVLSVVSDIILNGRAPKADPGIFVLALIATHGDQKTKNRLYSDLPSLLKTSTHLFTFLANIQNLRGWSRGLRKAVAKFYIEKSEKQLAYQLVKYRNRAGFTHRDALRLCHAKANSETRNELLRWAVGKLAWEGVSDELVRAFGQAQAATKVKELVSIINTNANMTWEMVPTELLNEPTVLMALLEKMPLIALIRNLNRFSKAGLTDNSASEAARVIVSKLTNPEIVQKSGIHPLNVVNAMITYSKGRGEKGNSTWIPNQRIVDALNTTYNLSLINVETTGKNVLYAVDISGSMSSPVGGMALSAAQLANVLAVTMLKTEPASHLTWFDTQCRMPKIGARNSVDEVIRLTPNGGGTDCSAPIQAMLNSAKTEKNVVKFDAIVILTDSETWAGSRHAYEMIQEYRKKFNPNFKVIEIALCANPHSLMPSDDNGLLRVVGFDSSVVSLVTNFIKE